MPRSCAQVLGMAEPVKKIQLQRDAWKALAEELVNFMVEGLDPRTGRSEANQDVVLAWQRRVQILNK